MEKISLTFLDSHFGLDIEEHEGLYIMSLTEYEVDGDKSSENNIHYKRSSVTEVYFGEEELERIIKSLKHLQKVTKGESEH